MSAQEQWSRKIAILVTVAFVLVSSGTTMAANKLIVKNSTGDADAFVVSDSGKIGIGISTPLTAVHINGPTLGTTQLISRYEGTTNGGGGGFIVLHNNASGALPNNGDRLGYFFFGSYDGANQRNSAGIAARAEGTWSSSSLPAYIAFETTPSNAVQVNGNPQRTEKLRITGTGYVGIGTTTPAQKLDVSGGIRLNSTGDRPACNSSNRGTLWLVQGATDELTICVQDGGYVWKIVTLQ